MTTDAGPRPGDADRNRDVDRETLLRLLCSQALTEYMTLAEFAGWLGIGRNKARTVLNRMEGVERCGGLFRVPVRKMPPSYLASRICTDPHDRDSEAAGE